MEGTTKRSELEKVPTGIEGLDAITRGGLPAGRPTLVAGGPGCGKTLLAMEFLVHGAVQYGEAGVFLAFEETAAELSKNVASLGFDLDDLVARKLLVVDYVHFERSEILETGDFDLEGLFVRLGHAIDSIHAKRVVIDTVEVLFAGLTNIAILRAELRRLFRWLKARGVTVVITGERGEGRLTRQGLEEYVSDCVIFLDHRVTDQLSTRRLRVVKFRGSVHGTNEYPFLIDEHGIHVLPITSLMLDHAVSDQRITSGLASLDALLGGDGFFRGSSILVSGPAGSGKTSFGATFAHSVCARGERCLFFAFEESPNQIQRNMRSIGIDLGAAQANGLLQIHAARPSLHGLEMHLVQVYQLVEKVRPQAVVVDPVSNLALAGDPLQVNSMLLRLVDMLKSRGVTALFVSLTKEGMLANTQIGISTLMDTWIELRDMQTAEARTRALVVLKSRGMAHSGQPRAFRITSQGIQLQEAPVEGFHRAGRTGLRDEGTPLPPRVSVQTALATAGSRGRTRSSGSNVRKDRS